MFQLALILSVLGVAALVSGTVLAVSGYSSAGPFAITSACVGVIGTLVVEERVKRDEQ